ncbi:uncharacterized protein [Nerophis lumbriciformis]|uniref:uncharacterized protein n=1 Tax=Nerophis lumbriciformis TaxID=546530 RepID=UPI002ADFB375|nr:uncharacterized protein LOC133623332 [Nerophis lumbriciformis]
MRQGSRSSFSTPRTVSLLSVWSWALVIMFLHLGFGLLALCRLTAASDPACLDLLEPVEDINLVSGKWTLHVITSDNQAYMDVLKAVTSSWIDLSPLPNSDTFTMRWANRINGTCYIQSTTSSSSEEEFTLNFYGQEHKGRFLKMCPDCLFWFDTNMARMNGGELVKKTNIFLLTKSGRLDHAHLEVFKKKATCLNLSRDLHFGDLTEPCAEEA